MTSVMDRRAFVAGALGLLAAPLAAEAQPAGKVSRIGYLRSPSPARVPLARGASARASRARLRRGAEHHFRVPMGRGQSERLPGLAAELVVSRWTSSWRGSARGPAAKQATSDDPHRHGGHYRSGERLASSPASPGRAGTSRGWPCLGCRAGREAAGAPQGGRPQDVTRSPSSGIPPSGPRHG